MTEDSHARCLLSITELHDDGTGTTRQWVVLKALVDSIAAQMGPPSAEAMFSRDQLLALGLACIEIGPALLTQGSKL